MIRVLQAALLVVTVGLLAAGGYAMNMFFGLVGVGLLGGFTALVVLVVLAATGALSGLTGGGSSGSNKHRSKGAREPEDD